VESGFLNTLNNATGKTPSDGIRLYDGQGPFLHPVIIAVVPQLLVPRRMCGAHNGRRRPLVMPDKSKTKSDPDIHKGAIEGDRPGDEQLGNPHGDGVDDQGLPDDPVATAEDRIGANEDETQG
jgi:hypothetical protein